MKWHVECNLLKHRIVTIGRGAATSEACECASRKRKDYYSAYYNNNIVHYNIIMYRRRFGRYFDNTTINIMRSIYYYAVCCRYCLSDFEFQIV